MKYKGDPSKLQGYIEVRGIVNKDGTLSFGEYTQYDNDFGNYTNKFRHFFIKKYWKY